MKNIYLVFLAVILIGTFSACSKSENMDTEVDGNRSYLNLKFEASYSYADEITLDKKASLTSSKSSNTISADLGNGIFSEFSIEEKNRVGTSKAGGLKSSQKKIASKEGVTNTADLDNSKFKKLGEGVKFMVLIFDDEENHIGTQLVTMGEGRVTPIKVSFKKDYIQTTNNYYRIVAFTYNTKDAKDFEGLNLDPSQTKNNPQIVIPTDKEFFYHNSDFSMNPHNQGATTLLTIKFIPQTVKVALTVDARGVNGKVKEVQGVFKNFTVSSTYNFDLKLNKLASTIPVGEGKPTQSDYPFALMGNADTLSAARYIYIADANPNLPLNFGNLTVELNKLVIDREEPKAEGEGYVTKSYDLISATKTYTFTDVSLVKGKFFNGRINLFSGFEINGTLWSLGNLYYDAADPINKYKFRASAKDGYKELTDYWNFKREFPMSESNRGKEGVDPCSFVKSGGWRMPRKEETQVFDLSSNNTHFESVYFYDAKGSSTERDYDYARFTNKYGSNIEFYAFGMRDGLTYTGEGVDAMLWASTQTLQTQADVLRIGVFRTGTQRGDGYVDFPDYVILSTRGLNIRCVRDFRN